MTRRRYGLHSSMAAVVALVISLVAVSVPASAARHAAASKKLVPVSYGISFLSLTVLPQYLMVHEGFDKKFGLKVNLVPISTGSGPTVAAVVAGSTPFAVTSSFILWNYVEQGAPVLAVAEEIQGVNIEMCLKPELAASRGITPTSSPSAMLAGLHGLTIGGGATVDLPILDGLLKQAHLPLDQFNFQNNTALASQLSEFKAGIYDGIFTSPPGCEIAEDGGYGKVVWSLTSIKQFRIVSYGMTFTSASYAKAHPRIVSSLVHALDYTQKWIQKHPRQTAQFAVSQFSAPASEALSLVKTLGYAPTAKIPAVGMRNAADVANQYGMTNNRISPQIERIVYSNRFF